MQSDLEAADVLLTRAHESGSWLADGRIGPAIADAGISLATAQALVHLALEQAAQNGHSVRVPV